MVCLGNICRSPLAEGILKSKVDPKQVYVDSAGTAGYHVGSRPDSRSIEVARKYRIDITDQRCRKFTREDFTNFDLIYAMDRSNYSNIIALTNNESDIKKVRLLLEEVNMGTREVPDPYYGGEQGFEHVYGLINIACDAVAHRIVQIQKGGYGQK